LHLKSHFCLTLGAGQYKYQFWFICVTIINLMLMEVMVKVSPLAMLGAEFVFKT
jgi:hypothetical protein